MSDQLREQWWDGPDDDTRYSCLAYSLSGLVPESIWQYLVGRRRHRQRRRASFGQYELLASRVDFLLRQRRGA